MTNDIPDNARFKIPSTIHISYGKKDSIMNSSTARSTKTTNKTNKTNKTSKSEKSVKNINSITTIKNWIKFKKRKTHLK